MYRHDRPARGTALLAAGLLLCGLTGVACGARPSVPADSQQARAATRLEARADADSLAAAANLRFLGEPRAALTLATRAVAAAPRRAEVLWLAIGICQAVPGCSSAAWEGQLALLDPTNAAPHFAALRRATDARDVTAQQAALEAFAGSERLDLYWTELQSHGVLALTGASAMSPPSAETSIAGLLTVIIPPFSTISRLCKDDALDAPDNRDRCRRAAGVLQRGDTVIAEMMGVAIAKRVWPEGSAEWRAADAAQRVHDYRTGQLAQQPDWTVRHARRYLALLQASRREQDLMRQQLVLMGLPPDPPVS